MLLEAVALLVLLAAAARAGLVAADLLRRHDRAAATTVGRLVGTEVLRRCLDAGRCGDGALRARILHEVLARPVPGLGDARLRRDRDGRRRRLRRRGDLYVVDGAGDLVLDVALELLVHVVRLFLVGDERVDLAVCLQADALAHLVHGGEVLHPEGVDGAEHHEALERAHDLGAHLLFLVLVGVLRELDDGLQDAVGRHLGQRFGRELLRKRHDGIGLSQQCLEVPVLGILAGEVGVRNGHEFLTHHVEDVRLEIGAFEDLVAVLVDDVALRVHDVVVLDDVLADVEVVALDLRLRGLDGFGDPAALDRDVFLHAEPRHHVREPVWREPPHDVVFERNVEARAAGVALAPGAATELVVDAARLVALRADDLEAAGLDDALVLVLPLLRLAAFGPAAEHDVGAAARHVGGDGDAGVASGLRDDRGLTLVLLGVEDLVVDAPALQEIGEVLGLLDRDGADEHGLAFRLALGDLLGDGLELGALGAIDEIVVVVADHRPVRRDDDDLQLVDLEELFGLGSGGARHAGELVVETEVVLERDRGVGDGLVLDLDAFLGLHRLVQTVRPAAAEHEAPGEVVDDDDLAVLDDVVDVPLVDDLGLDRRLHVAGEAVVLGRVDVVDLEQFLDLLDAFLGEEHGAGLLVDGVVFLGDELRRETGEQAVSLGAVFGGAADDQRRARFIDENVVDLVDDGVAALSLYTGVERYRHVVAKIVEAELVVGAVGDVGVVGLAAGARLQVLHVLGLALLLGGQEEGGFVLEHADGEAERVVHGAVPLSVALGEIVVDRDEVGATAFEGVEVQRHRRGERLALAGLQLSDLALVKDDGANDLYVVGTLAHVPFRGLTHRGEGLREEVVQRFAIGQALAKLLRLAAQFVVGEGFEVRLEGVDALDERHVLADFALVIAEDL